MDKYYGQVIWTKHALERLRERGISQGTALATLKHPDRSRYAASKMAYVYYKDWNHERVEVVAKKNSRHEWLVLSVWSKPSQIYRKEGWLRRLIRIIFGL